MKRENIVRTVGRSMRPLSRNNDLAFVVMQKRYNLFDVVLFWDKKRKKIVIHRIVKFRNDGKVTLHGDNNASFFKAQAGFEVVERKYIRGKLVAIIRNGRIISGCRLRILSALSLSLGIIKLMPFLIKRYLFRIRR